MKLNKSNGNMYDWVTHTGNVIKGECPHGCTYCYMKRWGKQNPVRFDEHELTIGMGSGKFIFVGSSCDMWANDVHGGWIERVVDHCAKYENKYLFQTKNPNRFYKIPLDWVACTTIETNRRYEQMGDAPSPFLRAVAMSQLKNVNKYVTIEPIMDFDIHEMVELVRQCNPVQVNIGADSDGNKLPEPTIEKVRELVEALSEFTVISKKRNLGRLEAK